LPIFPKAGGKVIELPNVLRTRQFAVVAYFQAFEQIDISMLKKQSLHNYELAWEPET
jgi:hypothetical protein